MEFSIFGSCVTRDMFTHSELAFNNWNVDLYLSRATCQSVLSSPFKYSNISFSGFDDRRFRNDLEKKHFSLIESDKSNNGFFLIDFIDERHAVYVKNDQALTFTKSSKEFINSLRKKEGKLIRPGGDDWERDHIINCILNFVKKAVDIRGNVYVHEAFWAYSYYDSEGVKKDFDDSTLENCVFWNEFFKEVYSKCAEIPGVIMFGLNANAIANQNHIWGLAPYHYSSDYYNNLSRVLVGCLNIDK